MNQTKPHIVIVGAGLAGLGAAYELTKTNKFHITLLEERDRVGGRVYTETVTGVPVDFGGYFIYPWYTHYHRLIKELELEDTVERVPEHDVYYQLDHSGLFFRDKTLSFPKTDTARLALDMARAVMMASDVAEPPLNNFGYMTGAQYLRSVFSRPTHAGIYETYTDLINQGYCYPEAERFHMSFMAPFIRMTRLYGDVSAASFIRSGNNQLPEAVANVIRSGGHDIRLGVGVTGASNKTLHTTQGDVTGDTIIFAQNVDSTIYKNIIPELTKVIDYTHYYVATVQVEPTPLIEHDRNWGGVFYLPNQAPVQASSIVNLGVLYDDSLSGYINLNIVARGEDTTHPWSQEKLLSALQPQLREIFPNATISRFENLVYWPKAMPIATEEFVQKLRDRQSKKDYYFAGDWLGAPSMETALTTGVRAAERVAAAYSKL